MARRLSLDERLSAVAGYVVGDRLLDIGSDHALLPISLCLEGRISAAMATDVNPAPLKGAARNVSRYGLSDRISLLVADGLHGVDFSATDVVVAGMGGQLIASILGNGDYPLSGLNLVLQPMTGACDLRAFLAENGYEITDERLVRRRGERRIYQVIRACFTGRPYTLSPAEIYLGRLNIENRANEPLFCDFLRHNAEYLKTAVRGDVLSNRDVGIKADALLQMETIGDSDDTGEKPKKDI
ncbi:MAG: SAM-dependent methyltransferase [Clostridia bacterium]|nr:SAM-dependent methyltransferase [Clostridia bacterium]